MRKIIYTKNFSQKQTFNMVHNLQERFGCFVSITSEIYCFSTGVCDIRYDLYIFETYDKNIKLWSELLNRYNKLMCL